MATMDIFNEDAFSMVELTRALENLPFKPNLLRSLGLYEWKGIRTRTFGIEQRDGKLTLIPFTDRGAPATQGTTDERNVRDFRTRHWRKQNRIWASEIAGIRQFGSETELVQIMAEVARRGQSLRNDSELTFEFHMLNGLSGRVYNVGGQLIYNFYSEFGITEPDEIDFDLDNAGAARGALRKKCSETVDSMQESAGGSVPGGFEVEAACGPAFFSDLTSHKDVMEAYLYAAKIAEAAGKPSDIFDWGGIRWRKYRGGSGVALDTNKCRLYPVGVPGLFEMYGSPPDTFDLVNTPGIEAYYRILRDPSGRNEWAEVETESNPMFVCTRPQLLRSGRRT